MTKQPKRIWIDADHGKHPGDWSFSTEEHISAKDHRKMGRLPYVPEAAVSQAALTAIERAAYERGVRDTLTAADREAKGKVHIGGQAFRTVKLDDLEPAALALLTQEVR